MNNQETAIVVLGQKCTPLAAGVESRREISGGRYRIEQGRNGSIIVCTSAPNVHLRVEPGLTINRRGLHRFARQTLFLDGTFSGAPFQDNDRRQYSLDHHAGCVRSVTLASCEQAAVVLATGLPINDGEWTLLVNEPDLDFILATWVLMNGIELLRDDCRLLASVMPLLKTEGNIDTYGFGKAVLSALPKEVFQSRSEELEHLKRPIVALKASMRRAPDDLEQVTLQVLDALDHLLMPSDFVNELLEYEELRHIRLRGRRIAVICRSAHGIYEVELYLRQRYGALLGMIVLDQGEGRFTLRLSDGFLFRPLFPLYNALNRIDANALTRNGTINLWGGANVIGGSPRATGSALGPNDISGLIAPIYGEPVSLLSRLRSVCARRA